MKSQGVATHTTIESGLAVIRHSCTSYRVMKGQIGIDAFAEFPVMRKGTFNYMEH